jgi:hypothetical protein
MAIAIEDDKQRIVVTAEPGFSGRVLAEAVKRMFDEKPQTAGYDFILDLRATEMGATMEDYAIVAQSYAATPRPEGRRFTCYVTLDQNYPLWAAALQHLFPDRQQKFFVTPQSAVRFLDEARA